MQDRGTLSRGMIQREDEEMSMSLSACKSVNSKSIEFRWEVNVDAKSMEDDGELNFYPPGCFGEALVLVEEWHI